MGSKAKVDPHTRSGEDGRHVVKRKKRFGVWVQPKEVSYDVAKSFLARIIGKIEFTDHGLPIVTVTLSSSQKKS